jgi:Ca2+-binding EF-hand superfamily protein
MRYFLPGVLTLAAGLFAGNLFAQEAADLFDRLDKNSDGQVAPDEVEGQGKGLFDRLLRNGDKNEDGKLSKEEFAEAMKRRPNVDRPAGEPERPNVDLEQLFTRADKNGDGKITKDEAPEKLAQGFDRVDANGDGSVDKEEFRRVVGAMLGRPGGPQGQPRPEMIVGVMLLKALDADGNGELSSSEIADAPKVLAKFDKNGDGKIEKEELLAQAPRPQGAPGGAPGGPGEAFAARLKEADKNGDGKLSKEEAPERLQQVFDRIDANGDGQIEQAEMRKFFAERRPE